MCLKRSILSFNNVIRSILYSVLFCCVCNCCCRRCRYCVSCCCCCLWRSSSSWSSSSSIIMFLRTRLLLLLLLLLFFIRVCYCCCRCRTIVPFRGINSIRFDSFLFHGSFACRCNKINKRRRSNKAKRRRSVRLMR